MELLDIVQTLQGNNSESIIFAYSNTVHGKDYSFFEVEDIGSVVKFVKENGESMSCLNPQIYLIEYTVRFRGAESIIFGDANHVVEFHEMLQNYGKEPVEKTYSKVQLLQVQGRIAKVSK